ncbi:hypothetical protein BKA62DRAFT_772554 [Auriculariales sp. MPI-PUGE-AT-0066]|nr:hypothetical protein BKA62DRAFT_772554 [Auriculariales sp. MPI-PUGE-AT-0066]
MSTTATSMHPLPPPPPTAPTMHANTLDQHHQHHNYQPTSRYALPPPPSQPQPQSHHPHVNGTTTVHQLLANGATTKRGTPDRSFPMREEEHEHDGEEDDNASVREGSGSGSQLSERPTPTHRASNSGSWTGTATVSGTGTNLSSGSGSGESGGYETTATTQGYDDVHGGSGGGGGGGGAGGEAPGYGGLASRRQQDDDDESPESRAGSNDSSHYSTAISSGQGTIVIPGPQPQGQPQGGQQRVTPPRLTAVEKYPSQVHIPTREREQQRERAEQQQARYQPPQQQYAPQQQQQQQPYASPPQQYASPPQQQQQAQRPPQVHRSSLAELKNSLHHLQEPHEVHATHQHQQPQQQQYGSQQQHTQYQQQQQQQQQQQHVAPHAAHPSQYAPAPPPPPPPPSKPSDEGDESSGTPRSPSAGLPVHFNGLSLAQVQALMAQHGSADGTMMTTSSAGQGMHAHVKYDIATSEFDPEVFEQTTMAALSGHNAGGGGAAGAAAAARHMNGNGNVRAQAGPYWNDNTIAEQLAFSAQMQEELAAQYGHGRVNGHRSEVPEPGSSSGTAHGPPGQPFSPPPRGTPYPYTYGMGQAVANGHIGMGTGTISGPDVGGHYNGAGAATLDAQLALMRAQQFAAMRGGMPLGFEAPSESAFSPSSTPFQPQYPFLPSHLRALGAMSTARSSPSHFPLPLEILGNLPQTGSGRGKPKGKGKGRGKRNWTSVIPPRVASTAPAETEYSGDEHTEMQTEFDPADQDTMDHDDHDDAQSEDEWEDVVGDSDGDDEDEVSGGDWLELEFHPRYVKGDARRRRKWEKGWSKLVKAFQELDRTTDATMVLMASPPQGRTLYNINSRAINRSIINTEHDRQTPAPGSRPSGSRHKKSGSGAQTDVEDSDAESVRPSAVKAARSVTSTHMSTMRLSFARLAAQRRTARTRIMTGVDGMRVHPDDMSPAALRATLGAMLSMFEKQEERWKNEVSRLTQERIGAESMLRQVVGNGL